MGQHLVIPAVGPRLHVCREMTWDGHVRWLELSASDSGLWLQRQIWHGVGQLVLARGHHRLELRRHQRCPWQLLTLRRLRDGQRGCGVSH